MFDFSQVAAFILIFARIASFMSVGPVLSMPNIPRLVKIALSLSLAIVTFPVIKIPAVNLDGGPWLFAMTVAGEVGVGLVLGYICNLLLQSLNVAGQLMDIQVGFYMASMFDPISGGQTAIISRFLFLLGLVLFLTLDGHHMLIAALVKSFQLVPLAGASLKGTTVLVIIKVFARMIALAVQICAPLLAVVLIVDVALGLLGRTSPQMNIFMLGFPIKIAVGILTLSIIVPLLGTVFRALFRMMEQDMYTIMKGLA